jgi:hypothetical protein
MQRRLRYVAFAPVHIHVVSTEAHDELYEFKYPRAEPEIISP